MNSLAHSVETTNMGALTYAMDKPQKSSECRFCAKKCQSENALKEHETYCKQQPSTSKGKNVIVCGLSLLFFCSQKIFLFY